jgi:hypothetical protein
MAERWSSLPANHRRQVSAAEQLPIDVDHFLSSSGLQFGQPGLGLRMYPVQG